MVYVFLADGFETIEALAPVDILRRAGIELKTVGVPERSVMSAQGVQIEADISIGDWELSENVEMVVLPGGSIGVAHLAECERLLCAVQNAMKHNLPIAAICAAPTLLTGVGEMLRNRRVTCYPTLEGELTAVGAHYVRDENVVVDGNLFTGMAAGSSIDFSLRIVAFLRGGEMAESVRRAIYYGEARQLT